MEANAKLNPRDTWTPAVAACCILVTLIVGIPIIPQGVWQSRQGAAATGAGTSWRRGLGDWNVEREAELSENFTSSWNIENTTLKLSQPDSESHRVNETRCIGCFVSIGRFFAKYEPYGLPNGTTLDDLPPPETKLDGSCDAASLSSTMFYSNTEARWKVNKFGQRRVRGTDAVWCDRNGFPGIEESGQRDQMFRRYRGKTLYFIGDSIIRNHMVLTAARMCNSRWLDHCWAKMPSPFWDYWENFNGPLGCVPKSSSSFIPPQRQTNGSGRRTQTNGRTRADVPNTACYNSPANFRIQAIPGLTLAYWPRGKKERTKMLKAGHKYPAMIYEIPVLPEGQEEYPKGKLETYNNTAMNKVTFVLLFIKYPHSEFKAWLKHWKTVSKILPKPDAIFTTMGAWLKGNNLGHFHRTYPMMLESLSLLVGKHVPIVAVELTPNLDTAPPWSNFVEAVLRGTYYSLLKLNISYVPVRFVHEHRQFLQGSLGSNGLFDDEQALEAAKRIESVYRGMNLSYVDMKKYLAFRCGYYDPAHAGLRCHYAANTLMLAAMWPQLGPIS